MKVPPVVVGKQVRAQGGPAAAGEPTRLLQKASRTGHQPLGRARSCTPSITFSGVMASIVMAADESTNLQASICEGR